MVGGSCEPRAVRVNCAGVPGNDRGGVRAVAGRAWPMNGCIELVGGRCAGRLMVAPLGQGFLGPSTELWAAVPSPGGGCPRVWVQYVYDEPSGQWRPGGAAPRTALPDSDWLSASGWRPGVA